MNKRRVVVTGLGIVSPVGNDVATAWPNVVAGNSGIGPITHFDASAFPTRPARARRARTVQTSIGPVKGLHGDATTVPGAARKSPYYPVYRLRSSLIAALPSGGQTWNSIASSTPERPSMA